MLENKLRSFLESLASYFKGEPYKIDSKIPLSAITELVWRRFLALARCVIHGVALNPRTLIFMGPGVELRNRKFIHFAKGVTLGKQVLIDGLSHEGVRLGEGVNIGPYTILEASGSILELGKGIQIGARSGIGAFSYIGGAGGVIIGENVAMGQKISIHPENHEFGRTDVSIRSQGVTHSGVVIEDDCWIGANVTFLDGAHVGKGSVIGAGAVVRGKIPPFSIAAGVPARIIRSRLQK